MENSTKVKWIVGAVIVAGLAAIGIYLYKQGYKLYDTCYVVTGAIVKKLTLNEVDLTILVKLENRSDISVKATKQLYDIYINEMYVSRVTKNEPFLFPSHTTKTLSIDVKFNPKDLLKAGVKNIEQLIFDKSKLVIGVKGVITAGIGIFVIKDLKFNYSMTLADYLAPSSPDSYCKNFK